MKQELRRREDGRKRSDRQKRNKEKLIYSQQEAKSERGTASFMYHAFL